MADLNDLTQNVSIHNDVTDADVTTTTDGSKERLDVSIGSSPLALSAFIPKIDFDVSGTSLNTSTDTTLFTFTGQGKIDFIAIAGSLSSYEVIIDIDGVEIFRIKMSELGSTLGLGNATNVPIWAETANKNFRLHSQSGDDFITSFTIKAKAITGSPSLNWLVKYREID